MSEKHDTTHDIKVTVFVFVFFKNLFESVKFSGQPEALSIIHQ